MDEETTGIRSLGEGRYNLRVGRQRYTIATKLSEERFVQLAESVQRLVDGFQSNLSQDERLFMAVMTLVLEADEIAARTEKLCDSLRNRSDG